MVWLADRLSHIAPEGRALYCEAEGAWTSYGALCAEMQEAARVFARPGKALAFLLFSNTKADVVAYLGLLTAGHVPLLLDPKLPGPMLAALMEAYRPEIVAASRNEAPPGAIPIEGAPVPAWSLPASDALAPHPELGLLLTTSGSTGSPKLVRLSESAIAHNTEAIIDALAIAESDRALSHLPLHYSYGLTILHTHLFAGASQALTARSMFEAEFWDLARDQGCTSLAATPVHVKMLDRLGLNELDVPSFSLLTQAGGRLDPALADKMHALMAARGGRFCVMYGQTEASPRMTTLPHEDFDAEKGSVGLPLRGGRIRILDEAGRELPPRTNGEVVYAGPNVMMGYAHCRADLARPDERGGVLRTGDLGYLDERGYLFITGRASRFAKVAGLRVSLDEVEQMAQVTGAAIERDGRILLFAEGLDETAAETLRRDLMRRMRLPSGTLAVRCLAALPITAKGKVDYTRLKGEA